MESPGEQIFIVEPHLLAEELGVEGPALDEGAEGRRGEELVVAQDVLAEAGEVGFLQEGEVEVVTGHALVEGQSLHRVFGSEERERSAETVEERNESGGRRDSLVVEAGGVDEERPRAGAVGGAG